MLSPPSPFRLTGRTTKVSDPATPVPTRNWGVAFSPDGAYIGVAINSSPYVYVYPWSGSFGAKMSNPATLPPGIPNEIAWI